MMNCSTARHILPAYLENRVTGAQQQEVAHHIGSCDVCLREFLLLSAVYRHMYGVPLHTTPSDYYASVTL